jgi:uncharacterized membrane protein
MWAKYFSFLIVYFIVDMIWIGLSSYHHKAVIENIQQSKLRINMISGSLYYIILSAILVYTLVRFTKTDSEWYALGFLMAMSMFLTFDLTNKTIFINYPAWYVVMDVVGGVSSIMLSLYISKKILLL